MILERQKTQMFVGELDFKGTVEEAIETLQLLKAEWGEKYPELYIEKCYGDDTAWFILTGRRDETDAELAERQMKHDEEAKILEEKRYKDFLKLRDEFRPRLLKEGLEATVKE
jgi:hypothetical protein